MINGTQFICALGSEAVERAGYLALQADVVAALTVEALSGISRAFDEDIHKARPHPGQQEVAERLRKLLQYKGDQSEITSNYIIFASTFDIFDWLFVESHSDSSRVQDAYTLRCCPQVHGIAHDTIKFTKSVLNVELNSATDNPVCFSNLFLLFLTLIFRWFFVIVKKPSLAETFMVSIQLKSWIIWQSVFMRSVQ